MGTGDFAPGTSIGDRYKIIARLGEGAFGQVWSARDRRLANRPVAIKLLRGEHAGDPETVARFDGEVRALAELKHPNVVTVLDRGQHGGSPYLVTELVEGPTLSSWLLQKREAMKRGSDLPSFDTVAPIFEQICAGVQAAHAVRKPGPIVHRDLKPANIVLTSVGTGAEHVKILDFGIARLGERQETLSGSPLGTPAYMSPEQAMGQVGEIGPHSDVFSLGVILLEMLTLQRVAANGRLWWAAVVHDGAAVDSVLRAHRKDIQVALSGPLSDALSVAPQKRPADASRLRAAVGAAWENHRSTVVSPGPGGRAAATVREPDEDGRRVVVPADAAARAATTERGITMVVSA